MLDYFKQLFIRPERHYWRVFRFHGGGVLMTPKPMTEQEAVDWTASAIKGEVAYVDRECGFIFYRPKE